MRKTEDKHSANADRGDIKNRVNDAMSMGSTKIYLVAFAGMVAFSIIMMILRAKNIV